MSDDLNELHWHTLKKRVEDAGGTYQSKDQAIAFLSEKLGSAPASPVASGRLDKSRGYGQVFGEVEGFSGAVFSQDGAYFKSSGDRLS